MKIIPYRRFWLGFSSLLVLVSIALLILFGLKLSPDFTEGTLLAVEFDDSQAIAENPADIEEGTSETDVTLTDLRESIADFSSSDAQDLGSVDIKEAGVGSFIMKFRRLRASEIDAFLNHLRLSFGEITIMQLRNVSPLFAKSFRDRAIIALIVAAIMIILYITFAFRRVSRGIKSWKLGVSAIVALFHDIIIIVGVYVLLGIFFGVEVDILFVTALLSVLGFSVNDTIVVFDRIRENLLTKHHEESFEQVTERSLQQTLARSLNTSFSTLLVLISLLAFGAYEIFYFVLALALGVVVGTYSSIFLAAPLLILFQRK